MKGSIPGRSVVERRERREGGESRCIKDGRLGHCAWGEMVYLVVVKKNCLSISFNAFRCVFKAETIFLEQTIPTCLLFSVS